LQKIWGDRFMKTTRGLFNQILFLAFVLEIFFCCEVFAQAAGQPVSSKALKKKGGWCGTLR
jgi:hypothetical protein